MSFCEGFESWVEYHCRKASEKVLKLNFKLGNTAFVKVTSGLKDIKISSVDG